MYINIDSDFLWRSWPGSVSLRSEKTFFSPAADSEGLMVSYQTTGASSSLLQSLPCASWQTVAEMPALFKEWSFSFPLPHKTVEDEAPSKLLLPPQSLQAFRLSLWSSALLRCCLSCLVSLFFLKSIPWLVCLGHSLAELLRGFFQVLQMQISDFTNINSSIYTNRHKQVKHAYI